ncbi:MAG: YidC/Oxa1 family membrane protein insertase, partial [Firmicutes bacterium]|nr:YidC/Oxa1 family membrane protein insertase [Bacillota bacterium]
LPLYRRADAMQMQARDTEARLKKGMDHIKKTFSGSERMMILQTYYRQNDYSPLNALHGSISLLLEIPFFMAAYQFLSHLELLRGVSFGPIADLGVPDGMISIGGTAVNVLPILMTLINFASAALYLKGFPLKTKIQTYGIALVFLVFLYDSPAGLVFYWTLNNVFSLCKNIAYKIAGRAKKEKKEKKEKKASERRSAAPDRKLFISAAVFLTLLTGLLIPSTYVAASPQEYFDTTLNFSPLWYIVSAVCLAAGIFCFWFGVFYWLAGARGKVVFERVLWCFCGAAVVDYMFFGTKMGVVSSALKYQNGMWYSFLEGVLNIVAAAAAAALLYFIARKFRNLPKSVLAIASAAVVVMSGINIVKSGASIRDARENGSDAFAHFTFSKGGKNVAVLFLDRAMGEYIPYIINEKPELKKIFDGFTYYSNVISFGGHTNMGAPALMGGYEYTPVELNRRGDESLKDKHNESLKVMPVMFLKEGFNVTVCDAPYANYKWIPDMSIYGEWPEINTFITKGKFSSLENKKLMAERNKRNFFCFSLMKTMPLAVQLGMYDDGNYLMAGDHLSVVQTWYGTSRATGISESFMESYQVLQNLSSMTRISSGSDNNYLFFYNDLPHETMLLKEPEYVPSEEVDNTEFDSLHKDRFAAGGRRIDIWGAEQMAHYQTNMATLMQIGEWLDYLRANGVYDNTRIILVADHGYYLYQTQELIHRENGLRVDIGNYFPLLMVKDFGSTGFTISDEFMTNADVPSLAADDIILHPVNPFTGRDIDMKEKTAHDQFIIMSRDWSVDANGGNTFNPSGWAAVTDDIWDRDDWIFITDQIVLTEHKIP